MRVKTNPLKYQAQADAYLSLWRDMQGFFDRSRRVVKHYAKKAARTPIGRKVAGSRTLGTIARETRKQVEPQIVYALRIGKSLSQDAFLDLQEALGVAKALANRYKVPVAVVDKKTMLPVGMQSNPAGRIGHYYYNEGMREISSRDPREIYERARRWANATGKKVKVMFEPAYGMPPRRGTMKPAKAMRRNPIKTDRYWRVIQGRSETVINAADWNEAKEKAARYGFKNPDSVTLVTKGIRLRITNPRIEKSRA